MFQRYQSLPKQVEAAQFTDESKDRLFNSLNGNYCADFEDNKPILKVTTIHGETAIIRLGDWVVKDCKIGTYYPIKDEIFRVNYYNQLEKHADDKGVINVRV
jgi:hypothetical protein